MNGATLTRESRQGKRIEFPKLAVSKRFGMYKDEDEKAVRKADVKENEAVRQMKAAWKAFSPLFGMQIFASKIYEAAMQLIKELQYSADDVEGFSLSLIELQKEEDFPAKAGLFLSALINNCRDDSYTIHTGLLTDPPSILGFRNCKNIVVEGHVGYKAGMDSESGTITINGNAGEQLGIRMVGGSIVVKGDANRELGALMKGGTIVVENAAGDIGPYMYGGSIIVQKDAGNEVGKRMCGGGITVNGNAGEWVGAAMESGIIIVNGNAGDKVGGSLVFLKEGGMMSMNLFSGGEIHINGETKGISQWVTFDERCKHDHKGRIYHKGKLIFGKEEKPPEPREEEKGDISASNIQDETAGKEDTTAERPSEQVEEDHMEGGVVASNYSQEETAKTRKPNASWWKRFWDRIRGEST